MAGSIKVSTQVLTDTATKITQINTNLDTKLNDINKEMNNLQATWKSDAAEDIRAAMTAMKPKFEQYKTVVNAYAQFLTKAAQSYETTESTAQTNATAFK